MRKIAILAALALCFPAFADNLPNLPTPPVSDGVTVLDHNVFQQKYIMKDNAWKKSLDPKGGGVMKESKMRAIGQRFKEEYLFGQRKFNEKYMVYDNFGGHTVYCEPAQALVDAMWDFGGQSGQTFDWTGVEESLGVEEYKIHDVSRETSSEKKSDYSKDSKKENRHIRAKQSEEQYLLSTLISIDYRPADLDILGEQTQVINPDESGTYTAMVVDLLHKFAMPGYELSVESMNEDILKVLTDHVTTGEDGRAEISVRGEHPGKAKLKIGVHYHSDYLDMNLDAEGIFDVQVGADTYEYIVEVDDNIGFRYQYTVSGRFSVWMDPQTNEWQCSSNTAMYHWASGLDSLTTVCGMETRSPEGGITIIFGDFTNVDLTARELVGDAADMKTEDINTIYGMMAGGVPMTPRRNQPFILVVPAEEGTFNFKITANSEGDFEMGEEGKFAITEKMNTRDADIAKAVIDMLEKGKEPYYIATATITKVDGEKAE